MWWTQWETLWEWKVVFILKLMDFTPKHVFCHVSIRETPKHKDTSVQLGWSGSLVKDMEHKRHQPLSLLYLLTGKNKLVLEKVFYALQKSTVIIGYPSTWESVLLPPYILITASTPLVLGTFMAVWLLLGTAVRGMAKMKGCNLGSSLLHPCIGFLL